MATPMTSAEKRAQAEQAVAVHGSQRPAAEALGISQSTLNYRLHNASVDPAIQTAMDVFGAKMVPKTSWIKTDPKGNISYSLQMVPPSGEGVDFADVVRETLESYKPLDRSLFAPRVNSGTKGDHLLVVDLADVHFGKLSMSSETDSDYNIEIARHRTVEGTRILLADSAHLGVSRILFVMGNDMLHTEDGKHTTSGTPQDTDQSFFSAVKAAQKASIDAIAECAAVADVDLLHCMDNHARRSGWMLSQMIAAAMGAHSSVRATEYNMSARKRKYYGYERNGLLLTHGDKLKEEMLAGFFLKEGTRLSQCTHRYAIIHDKHHKMVQRRGVDVFQSEKDHNSMTVISSGAPNPEGSHVQAEWLRSPSAPDQWHADNGYLNRQAVECFGYHPFDGQRHRATAWF
jgi:hypothetical protein